MATHDYDKILTRLMIILSRLHDGEVLSVKELAEEFQVSGRTILRDFTERLSGFPIYKEKTKYKMQEGFRLEKAKSFEDVLVLDILEKITEGIGGALASKTHKLLNKLRNEDFNPIYTKLNIEDISDKFSLIRQLEHAIKKKSIISCLYDNEVDAPKKEMLKPLKIVNYEGFWYLVALNNEEYVRKLYLKKISQVQETSEHFKSDARIDDLLENSISIWFQSDCEAFDVLIYASPKAAKYFKRRPLPTQRLESIFQDGSLEFRVSITYEMEIIPIIKYWIPHLKVIEPEWLQEKIDGELLGYLNGHEGV
jgi:predicted DNA-binding transcriptional regulator YafY